MNNRASSTSPELLERCVQVLCYDHEEQYEFLIEELSTYLEQHPDSIAARNNRGVAHAELGNTAEAFQDLEFVVRTSPSDAIPYYNLGYLLKKSEREDEAIKVFSMGLKRFPKDFPLIRSMADALRDTGRLLESLAYFSLAVRVNRWWGYTYISRAEVRGRLGQHWRARIDRACGHAIRFWNHS